MVGGGEVASVIFSPLCLLPVGQWLLEQGVRLDGVGEERNQTWSAQRWLAGKQLGWLATTLLSSLPYTRLHSESAPPGKTLPPDFVGILVVAMFSSGCYAVFLLVVGEMMFEPHVWRVTPTLTRRLWCLFLSSQTL